MSTLEVASTFILVEGGSDEELIAVQAWGADLFQNEVVVVVDGSGGKKLYSPIEILDDLLDDWDEDVVAALGDAMEVRSVADIVRWYRA